MNAQPLDDISKAHYYHAASLYGIAPEDLEFIRGYANYVYGFQRNGKEYILRVGHSTNQSYEMAQAEVDWILYLAENKISVAKPILSDADGYVERIELDMGYLNVVAFERAKGAHLDWRNPKTWSDKVIQNWGRITGRMHAVTKSYHPKFKRRYDFLEEWIPEVEEVLENEEKEISEAVMAAFNDVEHHEKTGDSYGLLHSDLHTGNFFVLDDELTIFDFDGCCYTWFISDIAALLYYPIYMSSWDNPEEQTKFIKRYLSNFWNGYETENQLDQYWKEQINVFIKLRDAVLYADLAETPIEQRDTETQGWLDKISDRLLGRIPYVDVYEIWFA
ncbi:MAG: phosphotransferase enzyme family protein [Candidatus Kariarchaeaceae archaeon]|jgi:Ser/Thr protein kinase RdoA (MazF antagonist)